MEDFNIQEMAEYIEGRVDSYALCSAKDVLFDCLHYYKRVHESKNININFTTEQLDTILNSGGSQAVIDAVSKEYELKNAEFIKAGAKVKEYAKICDVVCKIANIAGAFKELYDSCQNYLDSGKTIEVASECMQNIFGFTAVLLGSTGGGLLTTIISEQLRLGAYLLEKGTELVKEYNNRFEQLEEIMLELEQQDYTVDSPFQKQINEAIKNAEDSAELYEAARWYDAIMKEYGWLFDIIQNDETKQLKEQYEKISSFIERNSEFYDMYNNIYQYMTTADYLTQNE